LEETLSEEPLKTEPETAAHIGISFWKLRKERLAGRIKAIKLGHRTLRYRQSEIERYLRDHETTGAK
jgi:predicted DNA-binding transcriptional regulator AlpA